MAEPEKEPFLLLLFERQIVHFICLAALLVAAFLAMESPGAMDGAWLGLSTYAWFILFIANTVIHQIIVWLAWRLELHGRYLTAWFAGTERAFVVYATIFAIMFSARFILSITLAIANRNTLDMNPWAAYMLAVIFAVPAVYLFYSVKKHFGFRRAFGIDHFDADARNWPIVRDGIFRFTNNAMYVFGIGALWVPGFALQSKAALVAAAFSHIYIWVHYHTVEKVDMKRIYG